MNCNTLILTGSMDLLHEGDIFVPKTRTAMKCLNTQYSCFWPKTSGENVEIPFVISDEYGVFKSLVQNDGNRISACYSVFFKLPKHFVCNYRLQ